MLVTPCPHCNSNSGPVEYEDSIYCFSCKRRDYKEDWEFVSWRGITSATMEFYGVRTKLVGGEPQSINFPYGEYAKVRSITKKQFWSKGDSKSGQPLFGMDKFNAGQAAYITVTEGELDCLSAFQMLGSKYPAVSVRSSSSARADCERARDYLNSFSRIYLCFDNDNPGHSAAKDVALLFDPNKIYQVQLEKYKDANEFLQAGDDKSFYSVWYNAKKYKPKGILSSWEEIKEALFASDREAIAHYPFPTLDEMTYGIRSKEVILFKAPEKVGKTEIFRAIEHNILATTDFNIGIIHMEEDEKRAIHGLVTYQLQEPVHLPSSTKSKEEIFEAFKQLSKKEERAHFYSHYGSQDHKVILDVIRALVTQCHCKFIFLDHLTMVVTGLELENERQALDMISTELTMMTKELDFTVFVISHVNDEGKTRGSRNIAKVADLIISLSRDILNDDLDAKNTLNITVEGARFCGKTGSSAPLSFNTETYTLSEKVEDW